MKTIVNPPPKSKNQSIVSGLIPIILLTAFIILSFLVCTNRTNEFDSRLGNFIISWNVKGLHSGFRVLTNSLTIFLIFMVGGIFLLLKKLPFEAVLLLLAAVGGLLISASLKDVFDRIGPHGLTIDEISFSYPSGHATVTIAFVGILLIFGARIISQVWVRRLFITGLVLLLLLVGFGMVYLRYHYLTDILAGWLIGGVYLSILVTVSGYLRKRASLYLKFLSRT